MMLATIPMITGSIFSGDPNRIHVIAVIAPKIILIMTLCGYAFSGKYNSKQVGMNKVETITFIDSKNVSKIDVRNIAINIATIPTAAIANRVIAICLWLSTPWFLLG